MNTAATAATVNQSELISTDAQESIDPQNTTTPGAEQGTSTVAANDINQDSPESKVKPDTAELKKAIRVVTKLYENITGHDQLSQAQRDRVRELIRDQSTALDMKISGKVVTDGMNFESISKALRKENNKLDTLLEGKESLFKKFHEAVDTVNSAVKRLQDDIKKMEDES